MKLYNFPEIFGEYISTEKYREMLKNTMFTAEMSELSRTAVSQPVIFTMSLLCADDLVGFMSLSCQKHCRPLVGDHESCPYRLSSVLDEQRFRSSAFPNLQDVAWWME